MLWSTPIRTWRVGLLGSVIENNAIVLTSSEEFMVSVMNQEGELCAGFTVLPLQSLGAEYLVVGLQDSSGQNNYITIVATEDNTDVTITIEPGSGARISYHDQVIDETSLSKTVRMQNFEVLELHEANSVDITGTHLNGNGKVIAVLSGAVQGNADSTRTDYTVEQMLPLGAYGTEFPMLALPGQNNIRYKLIASEDGTIVHIGSNELVLNRGEFIENTVSGASIFITSTKPIMVMQMIENLGISDIGHPSMVAVPPLKRALSRYTFSNPPDDQKPFESHVMIIVRKADQSGLILDGVPLVASSTDIAGSDIPLVGIVISAVNVKHVIEHGTGQPFVAYMYSYMPSSATCGVARYLGMCIGEVSVHL